MRQATASLGSLVEGDAPDCRLMHHHPTDRETQMGRQSMDHHHHHTRTIGNVTHHRHQPTVHPTTPCTTYLLVYSSDVCVSESVCAREHFTCLARRLHCQPATATQYSTVQASTSSQMPDPASDRTRRHEGEATLARRY